MTVMPFMTFMKRTFRKFLPPSKGIIPSAIASAREKLLKMLSLMGFTNFGLSQTQTS